MKRLIVILILHSSLFALHLHAQEQRTDTTATDTTLQGVKMKEVVVTKDKRLPIFVSPETKNQGPRVKSLSDLLGPKVTDMIMHPFAVRQRRVERRKRKAMQQLWEYSQVKSNDELLREALIREGIDPDSLIHVRDSILAK